MYICIEEIAVTSCALQVLIKLCSIDFRGVEDSRRNIKRCQAVGSLQATSFPARRILLLRRRCGKYLNAFITPSKNG